MSKILAIRSRIASLLLAFALVVTSLIPVTAGNVYAAQSGSDDTRTATYVTGYPLSINKANDKTVKINATVSPALGKRKVKLQRYDSINKRWDTIMMAYTDNVKSQNFSFSIPAKERMKTTSVWRIYVSKSGTAKSGKSKKITLTTRNIKKYKMTAKTACVYRIDDNGTGSLIYSKWASTPRAQASTTKLMTAVLLLESGKLNTKTKISAHAAQTPWGSGRMSKGDVFYTNDLLYAMLLPSSNDAATAVAEKVGGNEAEFVKMMNRKASEMGLKNTHFRNPHGLDADGHYTTATELAKLTAYAYTFPEIRQCWATRTKTIYCVNKNKRWTLWTTNAIFSYISNFLGGKTGTEDNAGCCFTGIYKYKGSTYVTVVLGSGYGFSRWSDTQKLHKYIRKYAATYY